MVDKGLVASCAFVTTMGAVSGVWMFVFVCVCVCVSVRVYVF